MNEVFQRVKSYPEIGQDETNGSANFVRIGSVPEMDPALEQNKNISWVHGKELIIFYIGFVIFVRLFLMILSVSAKYSWTILNVLHCVISFPFLHWLKGVPFAGLESNQGEYERFTFWEQLDTGAQFTRTKKILTIIPIVLFMTTLPYYQITDVLFYLNLVCFLVVLIGKFPVMHRVRLFGVNS